MARAIGIKYRYELLGSLTTVPAVTGSGTRIAGVQPAE
jgi:hypothetical protein